MAAKGQCEQALTELDASEPALRDWQPLLAARGHFLGKCGHSSSAKAILGRFAELSKTRYVTSYGLALVHAGLGHPEESPECARAGLPGTVTLAGMAEP